MRHGERMFRSSGKSGAAVTTDPAHNRDLRPVGYSARTSDILRLKPRLHRVPAHGYTTGTSASMPVSQPEVVANEPPLIRQSKAGDTMETCPACGCAVLVDVADIWKKDRTFVLEAL